MGRKPCCSKEDGLNRGAWTANEDKILVDYIKVHGEGKWRSLPKAAGLKRCGKSCRLRWLNYLRPDIKRGNITRDEEDLIIRLHRLLGNRWSLIAGRLPGRTDNEIKNYWNTVLSKRGPMPQLKELHDIDHTCKAEKRFEKQRIMSCPSKAPAIANVIHAKAERCTKKIISQQQQAPTRKDDKITAPSVYFESNLVHETDVESESSDGSFTLTSSKEKNNASSKFRMDFDNGEIISVSEGLASDLMQLCDFDFSDINTLICECGNETNDCGEELLARPEGTVEKYWSGNDSVELEANNYLDSDFGFLSTFLESNEDLNLFDFHNICENSNWIL